MEAAIAASLARSERLRQSILKRAFEGRLVAQDPSDEPAGVLLERIRPQRAKPSGGRQPEGAEARSRPIEHLAPELLPNFNLLYNRGTSQETETYPCH